MYFPKMAASKHIPSHMVLLKSVLSLLHWEGDVRSVSPPLEPEGTIVTAGAVAEGRNDSVWLLGCYKRRWCVCHSLRECLPWGDSDTPMDPWQGTRLLAITCLATMGRSLLGREASCLWQAFGWCSPSGHLAGTLRKDLESELALPCQATPKFLAPETLMDGKSLLLFQGTKL